jgi:ribosomal protein S27E
MQWSRRGIATEGQDVTRIDYNTHKWASNPPEVMPGLKVHFLYVPTPCAGCGHTSYVRASNTTDKCARCGRERV